ncbi:MAG: phosphatidate cytidylyltransferase [Opitutaceae bacterium]|nr:phosphatidate cytidylyltransferase [Opitutaceae bacterium]
MGKRIFSTVALWVILGCALWYFRTAGALVLIGLISVLTLREFYALMQASGYAPFAKFGLGFGALITLSPWIEAQFGWPMGMVLPLAVIVFAVRLLGERTPDKRVESLAVTLFGLVYVALMLRYLTAIVTPLPGDTISADARLLLCLWLVAVTKFCDTGALLSGMAFGKHKMSPQISPKKTWEGAVGGVLVSMGIGALIAWLARGVFPPHMTPLVAAFMAMPIAIVGIVADLVESVLKRRAAMKDSGRTIPGIGGMFDLSDSLILVAPIGYYFFRLP